MTLGDLMLEIPQGLTKRRYQQLVAELLARLDLYEEGEVLALIKRYGRRALKPRGVGVGGNGRGTLSRMRTDV